MKKNNLILTILFLTTILFSTFGYAQTVTIGSQVWTSKNLNVSTYRNGDIIPQVQDPKAWAKLTTGAWCYYDNDPSNEAKYGKLFNWYAVNDPRGLAPMVYHIPTYEEWNTLADYLGGEALAGGKMKSTSGWADNGNGTNSSGFSGLPGGIRFEDGTFEFEDDGTYKVGNAGSWWSSGLSFSASYDEGLTWISGASSFNILYRGVRFFRNDVVSKRGLSVRCLRD